MQKFLSVLIVAFFAVFMFSAIEVAAGQKVPMTMSINGSSIDFTSEEMPLPFINQNNRTMVPLRLISEKLNFEVNWQPTTRTAVITKNDLTLKVTVGSSVADINGEYYRIDSEDQGEWGSSRKTAPILKEGRVYVPLRFIGEHFGYSVRAEKVNDVLSIVITPKTIQGFLENDIKDINTDDVAEPDFFITEQVLFNPDVLEDTATVYILGSIGNTETKKLYDIPEGVSLKKPIQIYRYNTKLNPYGSDFPKFKDAKLFKEDDMVFTKEKPYWIKKIVISANNINTANGISLIGKKDVQPEKLVSDGTVADWGISNTPPIGTFMTKNGLSCRPKTDNTWAPWDMIDKDTLVKEKAKGETIKEILKPEERPDVNPNYVISNIVTTEDGWIYYYRINTANDGIYRIREDYTENTQLVAGEGNIDFMDDEWIYYSTYDTTYGISRMRKDGSEKQLLVQGPCMETRFSDGWVYYISRSDSDTIYRMKPDGTEQSQIISDSTMHYVLKDDWIYYTSDSGTTAYLYKARTDGTEKTVLDSFDKNNGYFSNLSVRSGWVYYEYIEGTVHHYKIGIDGSDKQEL